MHEDVDLAMTNLICMAVIIIIWSQPDPR